MLRECACRVWRGQRGAVSLLKHESRLWRPASPRLTSGTVLLHPAVPQQFQYLDSLDPEGEDPLCFLYRNDPPRGDAAYPRLQVLAQLRSSLPAAHVAPRWWLSSAPLLKMHVGTRSSSWPAC